MICQNGPATSLRHLLCFVSCCRFLVLPKIGKFSCHCRKPGDLCLTDGQFGAVTNGQ
jgi:hypothetical protein